MRILVIDVGGSRVKFRIGGSSTRHAFKSGKRMTPERMVQGVRSSLAKQKFDAVSIGVPCPVIHGRPASEPSNLGKGWIGFDFEKGFGKRVKIINDAAMQALGSYRGGRMLFIGLGTGVGSALILDAVIVPLELGALKYSSHKTIGESLGKASLKKIGLTRWERAVHKTIRHLVAAFRADCVVIGGGNARKLKRLPPNARRGSNDRAFVGGTRLWGVGPLHAQPRKHTWVIT